MMSKRIGAIQIDYIIAAGVFIAVFAYLIQYTTGYYAAVKDTSDILVLRSEALGLQSIADRGPEPDNWTSSPDRLGLQTYAYRFYILVNNTQPYLINQSQPVIDIANELVSFNFSDMGFTGINYNSTVIYNESRSIVPYNISRSNITFRTNINANTTQWFTVYFDDDSNFTDTSTSITGSSNLTERIYPAERVSVLQYKKIRQLSNSNYTTVRNSADIKNNFNIKIVDAGDNSTFMEYGGAVPRRGNVIALQRFIIYQNATAAIKNGKMIVQVWK